ncbi:hypothetical protein JHK86_018150 [Glycine max]|nr:hypothetical protein JHK86_018150 [Glycine max]
MVKQHLLLVSPDAVLLISFQIVMLKSKQMEMHLVTLPLTRKSHGVFSSPYFIKSI